MQSNHGRAATFSSQTIFTDFDEQHEKRDFDTLCETECEAKLSQSIRGQLKASV